MKIKSCRLISVFVRFGCPVAVCFGARGRSAASGRGIRLKNRPGPASHARDANASCEILARLAKEGRRLRLKADFDAERPGSREQRRDVIESRLRGARRDVAPRGRAHGLEDAALPAHAECAEPQDRVPAFTRKLVREHGPHGLAARGEDVAVEGLDRRVVRPFSEAETGALKRRGSLEGASKPSGIAAAKDPEETRPWPPAIGSFSRTMTRAAPASRAAIAALRPASPEPTTMTSASSGRAAASRVVAGPSAPLAARPPGAAPIAQSAARICRQSARRERARSLLIRRSPGR